MFTRGCDNRRIYGVGATACFSRLYHLAWFSERGRWKDAAGVVDDGPSVSSGYSCRREVRATLKARRNVLRFDL